MPAVRGNTFSGNTFWENLEQMAISGGGTVPNNNWGGNYWSDYTGYDANGDGVGDLPYRAERFFENLTDREPMLRALIYSPAAQALEFAAATFPIVKPLPKLVDNTPHLAPAPLPAIAAPLPQRGHLAEAAIILLALSLGLAALVLLPKHTRAMPPSILNPQPVAGSHSPMLQVTQLTKKYGSFAALSAVSFDVQPGEAVALWGANGAGKSTLIKALLGLIAFDGVVRVDAVDVKRDGKRARARIGYVPQEMVFYAQLKGLHITQSRMAHLQSRLGLTDHAHKPVATLSGGLKQRLALAVALLADPPILLLDEPTANLDAQAQRDYLTLLISLRKKDGKTILFASHRLEEVEALASRVFVLEQGRLVETLSPVQLLEKLMPEIDLALWVPEPQRPAALDCLVSAGWSAHFNGRGTVVVRVRGEEKMKAFDALHACGIRVTNFEVERK
jgi:ABC-type multidrug transport system ATPase subunit